MGTTKPASYFFQRRGGFLNTVRFLRHTAVNAMPRAVCKSLARHQLQHGADQENNNRVVALTSAIHRRTGQGVRACNDVIVLSGNSGRAIKAVAAVGSMLRNTHSLLLRPAADKAVPTLADANCQ